MHFSKFQRLLVELRLFAQPHELPGSDITELFIVTEGLALFRLAFLAEMPAA